MATNPVTPHTHVDTIFGFTPARRARSRLAAAARTTRPRAVRFSAQPSATASSGATTSAVTCGPVTCTPPTVHLAPTASGNGRPSPTRLGYEFRMASESWATPIVATSTITRGARNSRRMTISSMTAP